MHIEYIFINLPAVLPTWMIKSDDNDDENKPYFSSRLASFQILCTSVQLFRCQATIPSMVLSVMIDILFTITHDQHFHLHHTDVGYEIKLD